MRFQRLAVPLLLLPALLPAVGCSDGRPARVPVSGQVLIDGQPLTFGSVRFIPAGHRASQGTIDKSGHFSLSCYGDNDGAVIGKHSIEVSANERVKPTLIHWHAPKIYQSQTTSGLTEEITGPTDNLTIKLTWSGAKPFDEVFYAPDADYKKLDEAAK